jgi:hypothetical protein
MDQRNNNRRSRGAHRNPAARLRELWVQHVLWTRLFIISTLANLNDLDVVTRRLLQNPSDFADTLRRYYGNSKANAFQKLMEQHLLIAAVLVNAMKAGNGAEADKQRKLWYGNAEEIAAFLASINPQWKSSEWRNMLFEHPRLTEEETYRRFHGQYTADVEVYDGIGKQALQMADRMAEGIVRQFSL